MLLSAFLLLLPLKLPLLVLVSCGAPPHLGVRAPPRCAVGGHAHVRLAVVDGPVLTGSKEAV